MNDHPSNRLPSNNPGSLSRRSVLKIFAGMMPIPLPLSSIIDQAQKSVALSVSTDELFAPMTKRGKAVPCGTFDAEALGAVRNGSGEEMARFQAEATRLATSPAKKIIDVAFHLILTGSGKANATDAQVAAQFDVLNVAYARTGLQFRLVQLDRTLSDDWVRRYFGSNEERAMMKAMTIDPAHTLNIYSCIPQGGYLGWTRFPWTVKSEADMMNGVVIHTATIPGVFDNVYDQGKTAVHEIGHYLGVFHTFQGGCTAPGDYCDDTPAEAEPAWDCAAGRDTCTSIGVDPVHNYMDYSPDACLTQFTQDQAARMHWALATYRPSLSPG
jgi:hypothetical protein